MDVEETPRIQNRRRGDGSGRLPDVAEGSNRTADDRQLGIDTSPLRLNNVSEEAAEDHEGSWIYALVKPPQPFASHSEETIKKIVDVFCNAANKKKTLEEFISNRSVLNRGFEWNFHFNYTKKKVNLTVFIDKWKIKLEELFAAAVKETSTNRSAAAVFADWLFVGFPLTDDGNSSFPNVWFKGVLHGLGLPSGCNVTASDAKAKPEEIVGLLRFVNEFLEDQQHLTLSSLPVETNPRQFRFLARLVILACLVGDMPWSVMTVMTSHDRVTFLAKLDVGQPQHFLGGKFRSHLSPSPRETPGLPAVMTTSSVRQTGGGLSPIFAAAELPVAAMHKLNLLFNGVTLLVDPKTPVQLRQKTIIELEQDFKQLATLLGGAIPVEPETVAPQPVDPHPVLLRSRKGKMCLPGLGEPGRIAEVVQYRSKVRRMTEVYISLMTHLPDDASYDSKDDDASYDSKDDASYDSKNAKVDVQDDVFISDMMQATATAPEGNEYHPGQFDVEDLFFTECLGSGGDGTVFGTVPVHGSPLSHAIDVLYPDGIELCAKFKKLELDPFYVIEKAFSEGCMRPLHAYQRMVDAGDPEHLQKLGKIIGFTLHEDRDGSLYYVVLMERYTVSLTTVLQHVKEAGEQLEGDWKVLRTYLLVKFYAQVIPLINDLHDKKLMFRDFKADNIVLALKDGNGPYDSTGQIDVARLLADTVKAKLIDIDRMKFESESNKHTIGTGTVGYQPGVQDGNRGKLFVMDDRILSKYDHRIDSYAIAASFSDEIGKMGDWFKYDDPDLEYVSRNPVLRELKKMVLEERGPIEDDFFDQFLPKSLIDKKGRFAKLVRGLLSNDTKNGIELGKLAEIFVSLAAYFKDHWENELPRFGWEHPQAARAYFSRIQSVRSKAKR